MYKLSRTETFTRSENREILDIYFREFNENIYFASINFRELGDQNDNFHTKNGLKVTNTSWIRFKLVFFDFNNASDPWKIDTNLYFDFEALQIFNLFKNFSRVAL